MGSRARRAELCTLGAERSMVYHEESNTWVAKPKEVKPEPAKKEKSLKQVHKEER